MIFFDILDVKNFCIWCFWILCISVTDITEIAQSAGGFHEEDSRASPGELEDLETSGSFCAFCKANQGNICAFA